MVPIEHQQEMLINQLFMLAGAHPKSPRTKDPPPKPKSNKGGSRPGAGRPKGSTRVTPELKRVCLSITIPQWLADSLTNMDVPPGRLIEAIIQFHLGSLENLMLDFESKLGG